MKLNINKLISGWLFGLIVLTLTLLPANAAVVQVQADTVSVSASGDTITTLNFPLGSRVSGLKIMPGTANCFYRWHVGATTAGNVLYGTWGGSTTATINLDKAQFRFPSTGMTLGTNDSGTSLAIFAYIDVQ